MNYFAENELQLFYDLSSKLYLFLQKNNKTENVPSLQ